jgi:hypothetical protein
VNENSVQDLGVGSQGSAFLGARGRPLLADRSVGIGDGKVG